MDYRVSATDPHPPSRTVAWIGGISALALAISPFLVWWLYDLGLGLSIGGQPPPRLTRNHFVSGSLFGQAQILFGLICLGLWAQYGRNTSRWMRPSAALLLVLLALCGTVSITVLLIYALIKRSGLPDLDESAIIGPGLYIALGAALTQSGCLIWLVRERVAWARMNKEQ